MNGSELIEKLTQLKQVKPRQNWVIFCRQKLATKMLEEPRVETSFKAENFWAFWQRLSLPQAVFKTGLALFVIFGLVFSGGLATLANAKDSLPGDHLYPVKIALEQAKLFATTSAEGKVELQNDIIVLRLEELNRVMNAGDSMEVKQPKIEETITNLQKHLSTVKDELPKLDQTQAKKVVEMVKKIDLSAGQAQQALSDAKVALSTEIKQNLNDKITEAADEADKTSDKVLEIMMEKQSEEEGGISQGEILAKLEERVQKTEQKIKAAEESMAKSEIGNRFPINASIIFDQFDKAKEILDQAKASLEQKDMSVTLQTVKAANEMVKSAEKLIEAINPVETEPSDGEEINDNQNATGTVPIIKPVATSTSSWLKTDPLEISTSVEMVTVIIAPTVQGTNINQE